MKRSVFLALIASLVLSALPVVAQEQTSSLQGTVADPSGAALPGVTVEAVSAKGQRYSIATDSTGKYRFPSIPPGEYTITAAISGMESASMKGIKATLGATPKVDLQLRLAAVAETISVTAEAPLVDVTSSATAVSISSETFERLPRRRDFSSIVTQAASANDNNRAGGIMIDGASGAENRFIMDGVDTTNPQTGVQGKTLITDFVDEVQVKSAGYAAEFGGATGGVINAVTKTGTNDLRGSVIGYYNDRSWGGSARPVLQLGLGALSSQFEQFIPKKDDSKILEPGVTLGGPVIKDRLWFFAGYEPWVQSITRTVDFLNTDRTIRVTRSYELDFRRDNYVANVSGNVGSAFLYKAVYNSSGYETTNLLPGTNGRGNEDADYSPDDQLESWTVSGYADFVASPQWFFSTRGGRFYRNYSQSGISKDVLIRFTSGSPGATAGGIRVFPEIPDSLLRSAGFSTIPTNTAAQKDAYIRDNLNLDASWFPQFAGTHRFKGGVQFDYIKNEVLRGQQNYLVAITWNGTCAQCSGRGKYGSAAVQAFQTTGDVQSENTGLFLQDSWTTMSDRLTLNIGVRTEQERVPAYNAGIPGVETTGKYAINFDYADKFAPRLGFAYDIFGNGRSKVFGSYGTYYDITKMEMPRVSFGGDKLISWQFGIDDYDWTKWTGCSNVTNIPTIKPTCPGMTLQGGVDFRHPSNSALLPLVDPDLKPMANREFVLGFQQELTNSMAAGFRFVNKKLMRAIEDVGVLVLHDDGTAAEEFFIANPGEGVARKILAPSCPTCPSMPKPAREYTGYEFEFTKRFSRNWSAHASYLYSKLEGNYSGLANSDEAPSGFARTSPNVNRIFDSLFMLFDQQGGEVEGVLGGDRPHSFKAQVAYSFDFGSSFGVNQYYYSGTPSTTQMHFLGTPIFPFGRNDLGRTPNITQTDLTFSHDLRLGRFNVQLGGFVLNLFDEDEVTNIYPIWSATSILLRDPSCTDTTSQNCVVGGPAGAVRNAAQSAAFFRGFDAVAQRNRQVRCSTTRCGDDNPGLIPDPRYGQPNEYQDPREVRVYARFVF